MSDWDRNPLYNPEACGLEIVAEVDTAGSYEFDIALAVKEVATGRVYFATDSGCSCPTPFEDHDFPGDDWAEVRSEADAARLLDEYESDWRSLQATDRRDFLAAVKGALATKAKA